MAVISSDKEDIWQLTMSFSSLLQEISTWTLAKGEYVHMYTLKLFVWFIEQTR